MRPIRSVLLLAALALPAGAQAPASRLTLEGALDLARKHNPAYQQALTARTRTGAALRSAWGAFIPSADANLGFGYRQGRQQFFGGVAFGATSDIVSSNWGGSLSAQYSMATVYEVRRAKAALDAADADITAAEQRLRNDVSQQYLAALAAQARAVLQDTLVAAATVQLELAQARARVGSGTELDVKRAQVSLGQAEAARLRERNSAAIERVRLFQQIGTDPQDGTELANVAAPSQPAFQVAQLLDLAKGGSPRLNAARARETAAKAQVRQAQGSFTPTLSLNATVGGFTNRQKNEAGLIAQAQSQAASSRAGCFTTDSLRRGAGLSGIGAQCSAIQFTDAQRQAIIDGNNNFPFRFTSNPYNLSAGFSIPLFSGFSRLQRVQEAQAGQANARQDVRAAELQVTADVWSAWTSLQNAWAAVGIQTQNAATAREALQLASERYRVGTSAFVDLAQARADYERAETDRLTAIYDYHRAYAALENAVGRPLR